MSDRIDLKDSLRYTMRAVKKYVDKATPDYEIKVAGMRLIDNESLHPESDEWYLYYEVDSFSLEIGNEYAVNVTADGVTYHGKFIAQDLEHGFVGAINYMEDGMQDIFFEEFANTNADMPRCLRHFQIMDNMDYHYNYNDDLAVVYTSLGEHEDGTPEVINSIEVESTVMQAVPLSTELLKTHKLITDEEKNNLIAKSTIYYSPDVLVGNIVNPGVNIEDAVYSEKFDEYVIDYDYNFGLIYQHSYTARIYFSNGTYVDQQSEVWSDSQPEVFFTVVSPNGVEVSMAFRDRKSSTSIVDFDKAYFEINNIDEVVWVDLVCDKQQLTTKYLDEYGFKFVTEREKVNWNNKQDKLIYKEANGVKSHRIDINGQPGQIMNQCGFVSEVLNLVPGNFYTVKIKVYEISMPSSTDVNSEEVKLYNATMPVGLDDINPEDFTCEVDFDEKIITYRMPAIFVSGQETGNGVDMTTLTTQFMEDSPTGSFDFSIYDKLTADETNMPIYSEDKSLFLLTYDGYASLIEYVEIIPEVSDADMVEVEVNNEFLETHRFITEEERKKWNNKQDVISDAFHLRKIPQMDNTDSRAIQDKIDLIRSMTDGLYVATYDIYFYGESAYAGITLENGIEDGAFPIYKNDIIQFINIGDTAQYCGIFNYSSGKACVLDVDAGIVWIGSATGAYLGKIEELFQYKCLEESVTYTKENVNGTMIGGTSYKEYQLNEDFLLEEEKKYHIRFEDADGKIYEYDSIGQNDGEISGKTVIKLYDDEFNVIVSTYESSTEGELPVLKVKVYNSSGLNDFGKITICKIEYLSSEFLDKYRFVTNEEKEKWNNKADIDDVFELLPAYDTRGTETITYEYDKIEEGKVTAYEYYEGREVQRFVKVADLTAEEFDVYAEKMKYNSGSSFTQELEETLGEYVYNSTFEGNSFYKFTDIDENEVDTILYANACVYFVKQPYSASYIEFPEAGVYFQTYSEWNLKYPLKMTINVVSGELKVIDRKYLVNSPGRTFDPYSIEYYDSDINTTFKYRSGEVFNNESNMALEFDSHAEGKETKALGSYSHTEGHKTLASGEASHAEGGGTKARGKYSHAEGFNSHALAQAAHAEGESTRAESSASHAEGRNTIALGYGQHVQGRFNIEDEYKYAHIVGNGDYDARSNAHTLDWDGNAWFAGNVTIGEDNKELATKEYVDQSAVDTSAYAPIDNPEFTTAISMGRSSSSTKGNRSVGVGNYVTASGDYSFAQGNSAVASGNYSHAEGNGTSASGTASHAEGSGCVASNFGSHAEGASSRARGEASHAEGRLNYADGNYSHAEGGTTTAFGHGSHAEGGGSWSVYDTVETLEEGMSYDEIMAIRDTAINDSSAFGLAYGRHSHSEGYCTVAYGWYSHSAGRDTVAGGDTSYAGGNSTIVKGSSSFAHGYENICNGHSSYSFGNSCQVDGSNSSACGYDSTAVGSYSHALGTHAVANANKSFAFGNNATADGLSSFALGNYTTAKGEDSFVLGRYNSTDSSGTYAYMFGNGTSSKRSNAHTLDWDGNAWFAGEVYIGPNNEVLVTKAYVDEAIANASLGGGSDVSDSGVIEDSEFDDLISDTFGPEYVNKDE